MDLRIDTLDGGVLVRILVSLLLWLSCVHQSESQTKFPVTSSDVIVLSRRNSPYVSDSDVTVQAGQRLVVEHGVTVKFAPGRGLSVLGQLLVSGRADDRVVFTLWENYKDTSRAGHTRKVAKNAKMKLTNGNRDDMGTLLIKQDNNSWAGVCDPRLANRQFEKIWEKNLLKFVCGELGFVPSESASVMKGDLRGVVFSEKRITCTELDTSKSQDQCMLDCCWTCESVDHVIGVDCASVVKGQHWGGIHFHGNSHTSSLAYVDIVKAGVKGTDSSQLIPALYSEGDVPVTEGVFVSQSAHHGIQYQGLMSKQTVSGLELTRNRLHGLHVTSYADEVIINNLIANENFQSGVYIERLNPPHIESVDFCSLSCVRCFHEAHEFPLYLRWGKPAQLANNTCQTTFTTTAGHVIAFRVLEATSNVYLSLKDGAYIDSPVVWQAEVEIDQWPNPPPVIVTQTNSLSISITTTQQRFDEYIGFVLLSGLPGSHGIKMRNVQTMYNVDSGIVIRSVQMPVEMSMVTTSNNKNGISIHSVSSDISLFEVDASSNTEAGLAMNDSDGRVSISSSHFNRNKKHGLSYVYDRLCTHEAVAERYAMHMSVRGSSFQDNSEIGLMFHSKCRYNVSLVSNTFRFNGELAVFMRHGYRVSSAIHKIQMLFNTVERNSRGIYVEGVDAVMLQVQHNVFDRNLNTTFWLEIPGVSTYEKLIDVQITNNKFTENVAEDGSILGIHVEYNGNYELVNRYVITDNEFIDNEIGEPPRNYINSLEDLSAVIYLAVKNSADLRRNILTNPKCHLEVAIGDKLPEGRVDLRYSFWDTNDINLIAERVFAYHQSYLLSKALLHPYLNSKTHGDFNLALPNHPVFQQDHVIGGLLFQDHILADTSKDYVVTKDIIVDYRSKLTISKGVTMRFQLGVGILVYGKLFIDGTRTGPVVLTADQNSGTQCVKLAGGTVPWEGTVQVQLESRNSPWFTLCEHSEYTLETLTLNFLCHAAGFQNAKVFSFVQNEYNNTAVGPMTCNKRRLDSCSAKVPPQCSSDLVLHLQCEPNYWSGIHLSVHAKSSHIRHAHFTRTGFNGFMKATKAAIQIDFNHHRIEHVVINDTYNDSYAHGIIVQKHNPIINHPFRSLKITKYRGPAFTSHDSRISVLNSVFTNIGGQSSSPGVYIGSFMSESIAFNISLVHAICHLKTYDLKHFEHAFVSIQDIMILQWNSCGLKVSAPSGYRVAVQVMSGVVNTIDNCGEHTLRFHDGPDDTAEATGVAPSSDGSVWIASRNIAYIVMHRAYHYQLQCLDLIIALSAVAGIPKVSDGLMLNDISISGFDEGIMLHELAKPAKLINITTSEAYHYGIHIYEGLSTVSIANSSVSSSGEAGVHIRYQRGNVSLVSTSFSGIKSRGAIWIWHGYHPDETLNIQVFKCIFENNARAIELSKLDDRYRRYMNSWNADITENVFAFNRECLHVFLGSENHLGSHHLMFSKNVLRHSAKGIVFVSNKYADLFTWNISNNLLFNCSNGAMQIKGSGAVEGNIISNSRSPGFSIVSIEAGLEELSFLNNKVIMNSNAEYVLYIFHSAHKVLIDGNDFSENKINHAVVYIDSWISNRFEIFPEFINNQLSSNEPTDTCRDTSALIMNGFRKYVVHENIFDNPLLSYEVMATLPTSNGSSYLDMTLNYWGSDKVQDISNRINDGRRGKHSNIKYIPFYKDDSRKVIITTTQSPTNTIQDGNSLSGYLSDDLILSASNPVYDIKDNLEIAPGVTLTVPAGITLQLQPDASVQVFGTLQLLGEQYRPVLVQRVPYSPVTDCFPKVRLSGRPNPNEGKLEILRNGTWTPVCHQNWTYQNAVVVCRLLGNGEPLSHYYNAQFIGGQRPSRQVFHCKGTETSLQQCPYTTLTQDCDPNDPVGMVCSLDVPKPSFLFGADHSQRQSIIYNVYFGNLSGIHVTGAPPAIENITLWDSDTGMTYIGQGVANEKDVFIKNVEIVRSGGSGISLYDITSNVTIDHAIIRKVAKHGIYFSPSFDSGQLYASNVKSSFHFCDSDPVMFVEPGENYKMYGEDAFLEAGCRRMFRTRAGFSIRLEMKSEASEYNWVPVAAIYDGEAVDENRRLAQFSTIRADRGKQEIQVESLGRAMTVWVYGAESDINYASVSSVLAREKDCSFERGDCGWHNANDIYSVERGLWFIYSCTVMLHKPFKGMERDVNFPSGSEGHYMVVGDASTKCNYNDARFRRSETAILESPLLSRENNLCSVSFHHYRSIAHYYREEHLTLYMKSSAGLSQLWQHTSYNNYSRWSEAMVHLPASSTPATFSLVFFTEFMKDCPNSVGIDDIMFHRCPEEKLVSTIRIVDSSLENIPEIPIHIWNNDPEKHNIVWIEKVAVLNSALNAPPDSGSLDFNLKSAYVLVRNTDITRVGATGVKITFDSHTKDRISEVTLSQNSIQRSYEGGAISVENTGINDAAAWLNGNNILHNSASEHKSVIVVSNMTLAMNSNLLYNNSGEFIVDLTDHPSLADLWKTIENNTFWYNYALRPSEEYTVNINGTKVKLQFNVFNNPSNVYDVSVDDSVRNNVTAVKNWWGSGQFQVASGRLRDGRSLVELPVIPFVPILELPPAHAALSSSCPLGWHMRGSYCYLYNVGAMSYHQSQTACLLQGAMLMFDDTMDIALTQVLTQYRDVDGSQKYSKLWIDTNSNGINKGDSSQCHTLEFTAEAYEIRGTGACTLTNPFICQKVAIVPCKNGCSQNGQCVGTQCLCNKGWEGDDCSKFHCRDVSDCTGQGDCVGANQCHCEPGWMGRACSVSYCSRYQTCSMCTRRTGCGWCDAKQQCQPGKGAGSSIEECPSWFYYKCMTLEYSKACTREINKLECQTRYCNPKNVNTDRGLCQECRDIELCYREGDQNCYTWDNDKCPLGAPQANYTNTKRIDHSVLKNNVKVFNQDTNTIYTCPFKISAESFDRRTILLATQKLGVKTDQIIISAQSNGIMHRLEFVQHLGDLDLMLGNPVGFRDFIHYADFSESQVISEFMHPLVHEHRPDPLLYSNLTQTVCTTDETVHVLPKDTNVYKCIGHVYEENAEVMGRSYFLVIPSSDLSDDLALGDVIASHTNGFLETVLNVKRTDIGTIYQTSLAVCPPESTGDFHVDEKHQRADFFCHGGNGFPGVLLFSNKSYEESVKMVGSILPGRTSLDVISKVIGIHQKDDFSFLEVVDVYYNDNGHLVTESEPSVLIETRKKKNKRSSNKETPTGSQISAEQQSHETKQKFTDNFSQSLSFQFGNESAFSIRPQVAFSMDFEPQLQAEWDWDRLDTEWELGAQLSGSLDMGFNLEMVFNGNYSVTGGPYVLYKKTLPPFYISIGDPAVPVIGQAEFSVELVWNVSTSGEGTLSAYGDAAGKLEIGATTGNLPKSQNEASGQSTGSLLVNLQSGGVSFVSTVTPRLTISWPAVATTLNPDAKILPRAVSQWLKTAPVEQTDSTQQQLPYMEAVFSAPFTLQPFAQGCGQQCVDPNRPLHKGLTAGIDQIRLDVTALDKSLSAAYSEPTLRYSQSECASQSFECCVCEETGEAGVWDRKSEQCLCPCCCDQDTGSGGTSQGDCQLTGLKTKTGECHCDLCPDRSLQRHWMTESGTNTSSVCPCTCQDGQERQMLEDGLCDCSCTCEDGSLDVLDPSGRCPCLCQCKNCEVSRLGPTGCYCPRDQCPVCETGVDPQWINCECRCPEPECGIPPNCVHGRRGNNCQQPDCSMRCHNCYGNGVCTRGSGSCDAYCSCSAQWEGECCERRRPRRAFGDPHIETLDGLWFDYFGIGQFWDCKSESLDFGLQVRYFYYKQTSFTGAIALKVGDSVLTVTTAPNATAKQQPFVRLDGQLLAMSDLRQMTLYDSIIIDGQAEYHTEDSGHAVLLLSVEFKIGVSVMIDVRYSAVMHRQFINVVYTLTKDFKHKTAGLCGLMDDDSANDLLGPDGNLYNDTDTFVESWRIPELSRQTGGMLKSWSWIESNFHMEDVVDKTYINPDYTPSYSISGFNQAQIDTATAVCSSLGIHGDVMDGCIFDVVITNDTSMAEQETLIQGCPHQCSGKGRCDAATQACSCLPGWSGEDCSVGTCGSCVYGECETGFCQCAEGWDGAQCDVPANCEQINDCTDHKHGTCVKHDTCKCVDGFTGKDCSVVATCTQVKNCSDHGICVDMNTCRCDLGWAGAACDSVSCDALDFCSNHGVCVAFDVCLCHKGWKGPSCVLPDCSAVNHCSLHGDCIGPNNCSCLEGYQGDSCDQEVTCAQLHNCHQNGICVPDENGGLKCRCLSGFSGVSCESAECPLQHACSGHGSCVEPNLCSCYTGYGGPDCSQLTCDVLARCSGHGRCVSVDHCQCEPGWSGDSCHIADCSGVQECSFQGLCIKPNVCHCFDGYQGETCSEPAQINLSPPEFDRPMYTVRIAEDTNVPVRLLSVLAVDSDSGANGEVYYSFYSEDLSFNINQFLSVDSVSGDVRLIRPLSTVLVPRGELQVHVLATDKGSPSKSSSTILKLTIDEVNDNCPIIIRPSANQVMFLDLEAAVNTTVYQILATDADQGLHGELEYTLNSENAMAYFKITKSEGLIYVAANNFPTGEFPITVTVTDKGPNPCAIQTTFLIAVVKSEFMPTTAPTSTGAPTTTPADVRAYSVSSHRVYIEIRPVTQRRQRTLNLKTEMPPATQVLSTAEPTTSAFHPYALNQVNNKAVVIVSVILSIIILVALIAIILLVFRMRTMTVKMNRERRV